MKQKMASTPNITPAAMACTCAMISGCSGPQPQGNIAITTRRGGGELRQAHLAPGPAVVRQQQSADGKQRPDEDVARPEALGPGRPVDVEARADRRELIARIAQRQQPFGHRQPEGDESDQELDRVLADLVARWSFERGLHGMPSGPGTAPWEVPASPRIRRGASSRLMTKARAENDDAGTGMPPSLRSRAGARHARPGGVTRRGRRRCPAASAGSGTRCTGSGRRPASR